MMDSVNIEISKDLIAPIVEAKIKAALMEALGSTDTVLNTVIDRILYDKVNEDGVKDSYSSANKFSFVDVALRNAIADGCREAMTEYLAEKKSEIKTALSERLKLKKTREAMAAAIIDGLVSSTSGRWNVSTHFAFESAKTYDGGVKGGTGSVPF